MEVVLYVPLYLNLLFIYSFRKDRSVLLDKINKLSAHLSASRKTESELKENCHELQAQVLDKSTYEVVLQELQRKVADIEQECSESKLQVTLLREDLYNEEIEKHKLLEKVRFLICTCMCVVQCTCTCRVFRCSVFCTIYTPLSTCILGHTCGIHCNYPVLRGIPHIVLSPVA